MLGKVLKKDFNSTWRFFLPLLGGYVVAAVVGKFLFEILLSVMDSSGHTSAVSEGMAVFSFFYLVICVVYLVACYLMTSVFVVYDFYKSMVSDHGYLTHTLPVKTRTLIWSKVLIAVLWQVVVNGIISLSVLLIFTGHFSRLHVEEFLRLISTHWDDASTARVIYTIINMIVESFHRPLLFFACIALGQLWKEHRIIGAILAYMGISVASQILNAFAIAITGSKEYFVSFPFSGYMMFSMILGIVTSAAFFLITDYMLSKNLNLE